MGGPAGWRGRARTGIGGWARARSYREYGLGLTLAGLLVSGAFGGLGETPDEPPATVPAKQVVDVAPFAVSVERVRVGRDLGVASVTVPEGRYLVVSARVRARAEDSVPYQALRDLVRLEGAGGLVPPLHPDGEPLPTPSDVVPTSIVSTEDAEPLGDLAPGLEYPVAFLFEQRPEASAPTAVTVVLSAHTWRRSAIEERMGWFDPTPAVRVSVPVTPYAPAPEPSPTSGGDG